MKKAYRLLIHLALLQGHIISGIFFQSVSQDKIIQKSENTYELQDGDYYARLEILLDPDSYIFTVYKWPNKQSNISGQNLQIIDEATIKDSKKLRKINLVKKLLFLYWLEHNKSVELDKKDTQPFLAKHIPSLKIRKRPFKQYLDIEIETVS